MDRLIGVLILSCLFISVSSTESEDKKENSSNDSHQKRETSELNNEYPGFPTHDQLAQEQNAEAQQMYHLEYQPQYSYETREQNCQEPSRSQHLKKIYVIPNQSKSQYVIMAPQVQVAPVHENNDEQYQEQQQNNQQSYVYYNSVPQQVQQEQSYPQQLFYPNYSNQNNEATYQPHEESQSDDHQKYMFIPYENEAFKFPQNEEIQQFKQAETQSQHQEKPFLHIRLLPFYPKNIQQNQVQENEHVIANYAPQYNEHQDEEESKEYLHKIHNKNLQEKLQAEAIANWQNYIHQEHLQQNEHVQYSKDAPLEKPNLQNIEIPHRTAALAKYAPQYQNHDVQNNDLLRQIHSDKLRAHAEAESIANSPPVVVHKEINILKRKPINIISTVRVPVPTPVLIPVPQPYKQYIPQPYPVPMEVIRPVFIPIEKTEKIEVEKPVPVEVEKIVHVPVEKKVYYKVEKPVPVEKTVHVEVTKKIPVEVPVYKPQKLTILRHVWEH